MEQIKHRPHSLMVRTTVGAICLAVMASNAAELYVPSQYSTINSAISAAQAGDEIIVDDGIYEENVIIDKSLSLLADGARIDVNNEYPAITIEADDVHVSGFDIRSTGASAIETWGYGGILIDFCEIHGGNIELGFSQGATVANCYSGGATYGIRSMGNGYIGGTSDLISNCTIDAAYVGISVTDAIVPVTVSSNTLGNCAIGINVGDCTNVVSLEGNNVRSTESGAEPLRFYSEFSDCAVTLAGNNVFAVADPAITVTAITLLNEGANTLSVSGHFNRFGASNAVAVVGTGTCLTDLTNNWWGKNSAPTSDVSVSPWLIMSVSPQSVTVAPSTPVTITCNWATNSAMQDVSSLGALPDSQDGLYTADSSGYLVDPIYDNRVPLSISGGTSSVIYYPSASPGTAIATLDYESIPVLINH